MGGCMSTPSGSGQHNDTHGSASYDSRMVDVRSGAGAGGLGSGGSFSQSGNEGLSGMGGGLSSSSAAGGNAIMQGGSSSRPHAGSMPRKNSDVLNVNSYGSNKGKSTSNNAGSGYPGGDVPISKKDQRERSYQIDKQIEEDSKKYRKECKILLLGSGESGKSTVVKQMKIIHQNGYSKDELVLCRATVYKNVMDSAQGLVMALRKFKMEPIEPVNRVYADKVMEYRLESSQTLATEIVRAVESLWHDPIIPSVMDRSSEFYLMDSASYFFDEIARIGAQDYVPNETDVLHARTKTTGISETKFRSGQLSIHMFDVGGQRSERKKWIHCFEAVTSIIFCVALSEYDQVLLEESGQNRMAESLVLFESVINSRWFLRTSIILFLNKIDLFKVKLPKVPLEKYFPEYTGGADVNKAAKYILWRFTQLNRARLAIYPHLTQATDTGNIRLVFAAVKETILQNALRDSGIL